MKNTMVSIDFLQSQERRVNEEMARVQKSIDEIPANRITKRLEMQKELEPHLQTLQKQAIEVQMKLRE
ncbi:MAG: hypothetical protein HC902_13290 [Calothrix sp. SM1_5_4]|nr:hypothetical protein [Calothrix sp. SM1_5_4]